MLTLSLIVLGLLFAALIVMAWSYNRLMWLRARAHQWWNHVDACRGSRHMIVRDLLDMSHLPMQHAITHLDVLTRALTRAEVVTGMENVLQAEMDLTDAIADLENLIDLKPPRYDAARILKQIKLMDGADRKLDDARRSYNEAAAYLNAVRSKGVSAPVATIFKIAPLPYFHHNRNDMETPEKTEELPPPETKVSKNEGATGSSNNDKKSHSE